MADANGNVHVTPGKRIPGIPLNQGKLGFDFMPTPEWTLGADMAAVGSRYFVGDDANQNPKLPGYWLVNLHAAYQVTKEVQLFGLINNRVQQAIRAVRNLFRPASQSRMSGCRSC